MYKYHTSYHTYQFTHQNILMSVEHQTTPKVSVTMAVYKTDIHLIFNNYLIFQAWNAHWSDYHKI